LSVTGRTKEEMMASSLILGGTKGLGRALAVESLQRGVRPVIVGRSVRDAKEDPLLQGAEFCQADLSQPQTFRENIRANWQDVSHVFWVAGIFLRKRLTDCSDEEVRRMIDTHLTGPIAALSAIHRLMKLARPLADEPGRPYHLVTVASTSSWRVRRDESVYCALKAAKAHFTRNFARELVADLPGSKVTLVNPGGIKTPNFWGSSGQDMNGFMEPDHLAWVIWDEVVHQTAPFAEFQILRSPTGDGTPFVQLGPQKPEEPF
jgi:NAD(P)-dependent dehydrogenase (short-subunit alcohol dehydrogenase family)